MRVVGEHGHETGVPQKDVLAEGRVYELRHKAVFGCGLVKISEGQLPRLPVGLDKQRHLVVDGRRQHAARTLKGRQGHWGVVCRLEGIGLRKERWRQQQSHHKQQYLWQRFGSHGLGVFGVLECFAISMVDRWILQMRRLTTLPIRLKTMCMKSLTRQPDTRR